MVFQIVDPSRLWVEALSFDALTPAGNATARFADGRTLSLVYQGAGLADRNQAIPVQFAVQGNTSGLRVGQFLTVLAGTDAEQSGLALPRAAIVRSGNGQAIVYEHVAAERSVRSQRWISDASGTVTRSVIWAITSSARMITGMRRRSAVLNALTVTSNISCGDEGE